MKPEIRSYWVRIFWHHQWTVFPDWPPEREVSGFPVQPSSAVHLVGKRSNVWYRQYVLLPVIIGYERGYSKKTGRDSQNSWFRFNTSLFAFLSTNTIVCENKQDTNAASQKKKKKRKSKTSFCPKIYFLFSFLFFIQILDIVTAQ